MKTSCASESVTAMTGDVITSAMLELFSPSLPDAIRRTRSRSVKIPFSFDWLFSELGFSTIRTQLALASLRRVGVRSDRGFSFVKGQLLRSCPISEMT